MFQHVLDHMNAYSKHVFISMGRKRIVLVLSLQVPRQRECCVCVCACVCDVSSVMLKKFPSHNFPANTCKRRGEVFPDLPRCRGLL